MNAISKAIRQMINVSNEELETFLRPCIIKNVKKKSILSRPEVIPNEIFFINKGLIRVTILDNGGTEHTVHFALENQFIADYSNFMMKQPAIYTLQAVEDSEVVVIPRKSIEWGYANMKQGDRFGRLVAEFYFIYQDSRIKNIYSRTPKERYDSITDVFPDIHNRVPQHMIASYLGITPIHLSRLKKASRLKL